MTENVKRLKALSYAGLKHKFNKLNEFNLFKVCPNPPLLSCVRDTVVFCPVLPLALAAYSRIQDSAMQCLD